MTFTPLLLAGGKSTRMRSPKHLLRMPDGRPLYQHQLDLLARVCPDAPTIYISLARDSALDDYLRTLPTTTTPPSNDTPTGTPNPTVKIIYDLSPAQLLLPSGSSPSTSKPPPSQESSQERPQESPQESAGPSTGLLTAYHSLPAPLRSTTAWLVIACDYPLLTASCLQTLCRAARGQESSPVTCFRNVDGFCEPLVAVWRAEGLRRLGDLVMEQLGKRENEERGRGKGRGVGPSRVVREGGGLMLDVNQLGTNSSGGKDGEERRVVLMGVNTREEWAEAWRVLVRRERRS
ncbi:bifunctional molybdenum cofactor biosynthesis protein [Achaetomium macrosporum]|uniref:Bifunctional molybdenum cofactor biosynthesis protein n=1 Tax=Achaetomium macrosporum TaxID=79813 RepID=A0AAN7C607_9PEZI|nr:bifunctional molybdenum cofactor biosynthesis protein [Achaetomium macrosporum]